MASGLTGMATVWLAATSVDLVRSASGSQPSDEWFAAGLGTHWWAAVLAPVPLVMLLAIVVSSGELITAAARWLLGPTPVQRLTALEARTEQLLERNRIARELHDSIGHALTVAVVQAGAARTAHDPEFTERALVAIEETGRDALDDLERVLRVLRESGPAPGQRPSLSEADRLLDSARGSGAEVDAEMSGPLEQVPGPVSREGYRILQESLTNVLRHSGSVPVRVRIRVADNRLELEVTNPLTGSAGTPGGGSGLRGIRERAALLGGNAKTGPYRGNGWCTRASRCTAYAERMPVTVLLVDDEPLVRAGLRAVLEAQPDIEVVGEAGDGAAVIPLVRQLRPDVVAMDVRMPLMDGIEATRVVLRTVPDPPKILVVTTFENDEYVYEALRAGADGFLLKRARPAEIVHAVRLVAEGESLLFPAAVRQLAAEYGTSKARQAMDRASLTERESAVLRLMARGLSNAEIAARLMVGVETVKTHVSAVLAKLGARDRTQAVIAAYESGFVAPS